MSGARRLGVASPLHLVDLLLTDTHRWPAPQLPNDLVLTLACCNACMLHTTAQDLQMELWNRHTLQQTCDRWRDVSVMQLVEEMNTPGKQLRILESDQRGFACSWRDALYSLPISSLSRCSSPWRICMIAVPLLAT